MKNLKDKCQFCLFYDFPDVKPCIHCYNKCKYNDSKWQLHPEIESALQQAFEAGVKGSIESDCNHKVRPTFNDYRKEAMLWA